METTTDCSVCAVAVASGEEGFVEEWVAYHRLIGVDHFLLYDNDPKLPLRRLLRGFENFVTVIDWPSDPTAGSAGPNLQIKTYMHALALARSRYRWVTFLDIDEFIVLRRHESLAAFLASFEEFGSVRLNWHVFGHNGYYDDPSGLVTSSLTRRMAKPSPRTKAISRIEAVASLDSAQFCRLKPGWRTADAGGQPYSDSLYPGKTDVAHINHYQCRSFLSWMGRVRRGDVSFDRSDIPPEHAWRLDEHLCLRQFVETVARDKNELVDEYMLRFESRIHERLAVSSARRASPGPRLTPAEIAAAVHGSPALSLRRDLPPVSAVLSRYLERMAEWRLQRRSLRGPAGRS